MNRLANAMAMIGNIVMQLVRHWFLRRRGVLVARSAIIKARCTIYGQVTIGSNTLVHASELDGRGGISIGENVLLLNCSVITAQHSIDSPVHQATYAKTIIEDYVIVYQGALILPGRQIGRGAVVAAHSVVTKDVPPMWIVGGNPARQIRRRHCLHEKCDLQAIGGLNFREKLPPWLKNSL
jgi:acetyltransferase-like isoleucine patch superfamily enzyme